MTAPATVTAPRQRAIPDSLVYEVMDGQKIYYRNYKQVLNYKAKKQDIMGYGALQWMLLSIITDFFKQTLHKKLYQVWGGEGGIHLGHNDNLSLDLIIFETSQIDLSNLKNKYIDFPPKCVIEVDTKAQIEVANDINYYTKKTKKLLAFGVTEVIWIFTETRTVWVAKPNTAWLILDWTAEITVMNQPLCIENLMIENGIS